jgi:hypothetical protein
MARRRKRKPTPTLEQVLKREGVKRPKRKKRSPLTEYDLKVQEAVRKKPKKERHPKPSKRNALDKRVGGSFESGN